MTKNNTIIVGIGHPFRGDDGLGHHVIEALRPHLPPHVDARTLLGDISGLLDIFESYQNVYLVDAIVTQTCAPGTRYRLEGDRLTQLSNACRTSTHAFDISQTLKMAHNLDMMPQNLVVYGIEAQDFSEGKGLSQDVAEQLQALVSDIVNEILTTD
jgi:hydrogenase maturation protease